MDVEVIIRELKSLSNPEAVKGMARFGINPHNTFGVSVPNLRTIAKEAGKNHKLARELWDTGIHEARILASIVDSSKLVTEAQMESWVKDFDSWDVCDQCCMNLFDQTSCAFQKAAEWSQREEEFVRRAGFALMAALAVHDRKAPDTEFLNFLPLIKSQATDSRNFVRKAVNWALRQIGKRNQDLNASAVRMAEEIKQINSASARWIAGDAIRELTGEAVQKRLCERKK